MKVSQRWGPLYTIAIMYIQRASWDGHNTPSMSMSTEVLLLAIIHKRDEQIRAMRASLNEYIPTTMTAHQLIYKMRTLCAPYGRTLAPSQTDESNTPFQQQEIATSAAFTHRYPLTSATCRALPHPSAQGGSKPEVLWIVQHVFGDIAVKFIRSFIEQKTIRSMGETFTIGDQMRIVALKVFNIVVPESLPRERVLLALNNNCENGVYDTTTLVASAIKKLASMRWSSTHVGVVESSAPIIDIASLYSLANCFELAYRWNGYVHSLAITSPNQLMNYETEFHTLYAPSYPPLTSDSTPQIAFVPPPPPHLIAQQVKTSTMQSSTRPTKPPLMIMRRSSSIIQLQAAQKHAEMVVARYKRAITHATAAALKCTAIEPIDEEDV